MVVVRCENDNFHSDDLFSNSEQNNGWVESEVVMGVIKGMWAKFRENALEFHSRSYDVR